MKKTFLYIIIIFLCREAFAQKLSKTVVLEARIHTGLNIPFYEALDYIINDDVSAFDISISFPTDGSDMWEKIYRQPRTGFGYSHWELGNTEILGNAHALYCFIGIPVLRSGRFALNFQPSAGGALLTRNFDISNNYLNRAIGSPVNVFIRLGISGNFRISHRSEIILESGLTHFSNGKTRSPNYGINAGTISVGMNYSINYTSPGKPPVDYPENEKKYFNTLLISAGPKVYDNLKEQKYLSGTITYNIEKEVNSWGKAGLGIFTSYDGSIREGLKEEKNDENAAFSRMIRIGAHASYSCRYKRVITGLQIGHYVYSKYKVLTNIYNRVYLQYKINPNLLGSVSIKSHWGKADCFEYGIGYTW
ncbi:MAG TPA: acyloxyacyl hydrolase [Bacteroidales bacterium]|nr:acyloxyacyl hydrolase [Bacteroidales bacterium]